MKSNHLFIYVEGKDDKSFINVIFEKCFKNYTPHILKYANSSDEKIIRELEKLKNDGKYYVMLADKDSNSIESNKQSKSEKYGIAESHIVIVDQCIEGWYTAGSDIDYCKGHEKTEDITKKKFEKLSGGTRHARQEKLQEILKNFDVEKSKKQSKSFKYFYENLESIIKE